jgi:hypothetical protein
MSRADTPPRTNRDDQAQPPKLELSPTQLAGGALASVTSAVAASRFGVTGTVMGAAFGSLVSGVAAAVYAASLKRASYRIKTTKTLVLRSSVPVDGESEPVVDPGDPTALPPELSGRAVSLPGQSESATFTEQSVSHAGRGVRERPRRSVWKPLMLLTLFAFVVSIAAIGIFETAIGHPISNSKDTGTSFGSVVKEVGGGSADTETSTSTHTRSSESTSTTSSDSGSPSATDSASPGASDSASQGPTDSPTPSDAGTPSPTDTAGAGAGAGSAAAAPPPTAGAAVASPGQSG